ncbi:FHA domain-containing protein [Mycetocola zhujimingii]|uniref:FHA domain-containing protein n=1 Tax=Mycetocola zhujimingii TaxID=2079792 RepID=A0A2U1TF53_9MICO|nr:FHA domain-containing protein [Mycetocola zhujimingii]PWC07512.1 hypothetical protein DF223_05545 [Mycetocola zhujimingii]
MTNQGTPWICIAGESILVAIRTPSEPAVVEALWALVRDGSATFDQVTSKVPNARDGAPASFVVVELLDDGDEAGGPAITLLVHGDGVLDLQSNGEWRRVAPPAGQAWLRDSVSGVSALATGALTSDPGSPAGGVSFPLGAGVIVANRIDWSTLASRTDAAASAVAAQADRDAATVAPPAEADAHAAPAQPPVAEAPVARVPAGAPAPAAGASPVPPVDVSIATAAGQPPVPPAPAPAGTPPLTHRPAATRQYSPAETDTIIRPPVKRVKAQDDPQMRHDGQTVLRRDIAPPIEDETVLREAPLVPDDPKTLLYGFRINGGQAYPLDAVHYFGRNPRQPRIPLPDPSRLVPVVSASKSVSATHLEIKQIGDSIVATDLKSTNGTSVIAPQSHWQRLRAGESVVVIPGTFIDIGDGNVIEILPPWPGV